MKGVGTMQMCGECMQVYDESEYAKCPYCSDDEQPKYVIIYDKKAGIAKSVPEEEAYLYED